MALSSSSIVATPPPRDQGRPADRVSMVAATGRIPRRRGDVCRSWLRHGLWAPLIAVATALPGKAADVRPIAEVVGLPRDVLETRPEVAVRGTVIRTRKAKKDMILDDASAGIWVDVDALAAGDGPPLDTTTIEPGMEVEVVGTVSPGGFSPPLAAKTVRILGAGPLPPARVVDPERFFAGAEDCRLVELTAVLQHPEDFGDLWKITMESSSRLLSVEIPKAGLDIDPRDLVDAVVRISGPTVSLFNTRGEFLRPWVFVDRPEWFAVVAAPRAVDDVPRVPLATLAGFRTVPLGGHRVRSTATVVHSVPGRFVDLQEGARGIRAVLLPEGAGTEPFAPGTVVEVNGFLDRGPLVTGLRHTQVRRVGAGAPPEPIAILPSRILELNRQAATTSMLARPGDYEGCLVRFHARLVQRQPVEGGGLFVLEALDHRDGAGGAVDAVVTAEFDADSFAALAGVEPGSVLDVAGIVHVDWTTMPVDWPPLVPRAVRLSVRHAADVRLLSGPPWLTRGRLLTTLALTGAVLAAALAWATTLRWRLAAQKRQLVAEMRSRRDAALDFEATLRERTRLAANLHDTLQQTIAGIGFQLDACAAVEDGGGDDGGRHFAVARRMVRHAAEELQANVWAMRSLPLDGKPFADALEALVTRLADGHDVRIEVHTDGPLGDLPEFVAGSILLVIQEAVHNALKHAAATRIEVGVGIDPRTGALRARVVDDGHGFVVGSEVGPRDGHFGLAGMRDRAERLGGTLAIRSTPAAGTTVEAIVQRRDYDTAIGSAPPHQP